MNASQKSYIQSKDRLLQLCDFKAVRDDSFNNLTEADCEALETAAGYHSIDCCLATYIREKYLERSIPAAFLNKWDFNHEWSKNRLEIMRAHLMELSRECRIEGITFVLLKTAAMAVGYYQSAHQIACFGDLDLLIRDTDSEVMPAILSKLGYQWEKFEDSILATHPVFPVAMDIHFISVNDRGIEGDIFRNPSVCSAGDQHFRVPSIESMIAYRICHNTVHHHDWIDFPLKDIIDLRFLFASFAGSLDHEKLNHLLKKYHLLNTYTILSKILYQVLPGRLYRLLFGLIPYSTPLYYALNRIILYKIDDRESSAAWFTYHVYLPLKINGKGVLQSSVSARIENMTVLRVLAMAKNVILYVIATVYSVIWSKL